MNKKIIIAIDGFSSTGKSTIAKIIAKELGYIYVDTGAMYRSVAYFAMKNNLISKSKFKKEELIEHLKNISISFQFNTALGYAEVYLNGKNIERQIRTLEVSNFVSSVAKLSEVRRKLVAEQQEMGKEKGIVMDGRDIGTVVFPNAELKLFMTASSKVRAERRYKELISNGENVSFEAVLKNVVERDEIDSSREDSPLIKADDAILIDNSNLNIEEQMIKIMKLINEKIN